MAENLLAEVVTSVIYRRARSCGRIGEWDKMKKKFTIFGTRAMLLGLAAILVYGAAGLASDAYATYKNYERTHAAHSALMLVESNNWLIGEYRTCTVSAVGIYGCNGDMLGEARTFEIRYTGDWLANKSVTCQRYESYFTCEAMK